MTSAVRPVRATKEAARLQGPRAERSALLRARPLGSGAEDLGPGHRGWGEGHPHRAAGRYVRCWALGIQVLSDNRALFGTRR